MAVHDRFVVFHAEDQNANFGEEFYVADVTDLSGTASLLRDFAAGSSDIAFEASMNLFDGKTAYFALALTSQTHLSGDVVDDDDEVDQMLSGDIRIVEVNETGGFAGHMDVSLGAIFGDIVDNREAYYQDSEAEVLWAIAPCQADSNLVCAVSWGPGQDPPVDESVLFSSAAFAGPNAFMKDGRGVLLFHAPNQTAAIDRGFELAYFDLSSPASPVRIDVDQMDTFMRLNDYHTHMRPVDNHTICWFSHISTT